MQRLCDEVVQLIFYELTDPSPLTFVSKRFHRFSQDPYVRAHYFLTRYGQTEAMFYALGRGKIITERVLDILLTSGAHLSRYLIQISMHHYFYTQSHFIKTSWVRNVPLRVFAYFLKLAEDKYGEIPRGKGDDDGSIFTAFLKESRLPPQMKNVGWETIQEILEKYNFIPFSNKVFIIGILDMALVKVGQDPIMAQFPLVLAIEPRLLPYAVQNGFHMDSKYRDFVFRKMFERPASSSATRAEDIAHNVRELCRLDPTMFVSRTVAAEVCMEAKVNDTGYTALKQLDKSGHLRFELADLVEDLIKTFLKTRSISNTLTIDILRYLFTDFPSSDPTVRLVILITVFVTSENLHSSPVTIHTKLEALSLTPVTKKDAYNILINPFVERYHVLLDYARREIGEKEDGTKGMGPSEIRGLIESVAAKCLEVACKGKLLKKLYDGFPSLHEMIMRLVLEKYQIILEEIPSWEDGDAFKHFEGKLCRDFLKFGMADRNDEESEVEGDEDMEQEGDDMMAIESVDEAEGNEDTSMELGSITQESLTTMIRHDEVTPVRSRRRIYYQYGTYGDSSGKLHYPHDPLHVGRWAKSQFGTKSSVTAVFMTHAVINDNCNILHHYLMYADGSPSSSTAAHVPVTFKHFQILARLGRAPNFYLYHDIEVGAEFYLDEDDYVSKTDTARKVVGLSKVKTEASQTFLPSSSTSRGRIEGPLSSSTPSLRGKKRPRRTATSVRSYAVPDSDDDAIVEGEDMEFPIFEYERRSKNVESSLQRWLKHLGGLVKEEQRKYKEKKKRIEMTSDPDTKVRVAKSDFLKSLSSNLRNLRRVEEEKRAKLYGPDVLADDYSDDDEYYYKTARAKRRRTVRAS